MRVYEGIHGFRRTEQRQSLGPPGFGAALERIERYGPRLRLQQGSGLRTGVAAISDAVRDLRRSIPGPLVVVVDCLQKAPSFPETEEEAQRVAQEVQGLNDLALSVGGAIIGSRRVPRIASSRDAKPRHLRPQHPEAIMQPAHRC